MKKILMTALIGVAALLGSGKAAHAQTVDETVRINLTDKVKGTVTTVGMFDVTVEHIDGAVVWSVTSHAAPSNPSTSVVNDIAFSFQHYNTANGQYVDQTVNKNSAVTWAHTGVNWALAGGSTVADFRLAATTANKPYFLQNGVTFTGQIALDPNADSIDVIDIHMLGYSDVNKLNPSTADAGTGEITTGGSGSSALSTVPEPGSLALLLPGMVPLAVAAGPLARRRRRRKESKEG